MKHEYRETKAPTIEENYDRPEKKRGGKKKPFRVVTRVGWRGFNAIVSGREITLGRYETHERAAQAMKKLELVWGDCEIEVNT